MKTILITGGAGFIGSALVRMLIQKTDYRIINIDNLSYSGSLLNLPLIVDSDRYKFINTDILERQTLDDVFSKYRPGYVMHLAAESHVDRSISGPDAFIRTNIMGTFSLLESSRKFYDSLGSDKEEFRFLHVSTDEVYGALGDSGEFTEITPYAPNSPYSASNASSDHLVRAWFHTYGLPAIITNCSNNYGPYQYPEKLIPVIITKILSAKNIPIYGSGKQIRDWLHVDDHVRALIKVVESGTPGETYNIGARNERTNIEIALSICKIMDEICPTFFCYTDLIEFVKDRAGHDFRYAINPSKIEKELGWSPEINFEDGLRSTVQWYFDNQEWVKSRLG